MLRGRKVVRGLLVALLVGVEGGRVRVGKVGLDAGTVSSRELVKLSALDSLSYGTYGALLAVWSVFGLSLTLLASRSEAYLGTREPCKLMGSVGTLTSDPAMPASPAASMLLLPHDDRAW